MAEIFSQLAVLGADRQIRDFCALRRDLTIPGKHQLRSYLHRTVLGLWYNERKAQMEHHSPLVSEKFEQAGFMRLLKP